MTRFCLLQNMLSESKAMFSSPLLFFLIHKAARTVAATRDLISTTLVSVIVLLALPDICPSLYVRDNDKNVLHPNWEDI